MGGGWHQRKQISLRDPRREDQKSPLDAQVFHTEADNDIGDNPAERDAPPTALALPELLTLRVLPQSQRATKWPLYHKRQGPREQLTKIKAGPAGSTKKKKKKKKGLASCRKTTLESPDDFATLAHDRKVSYVADLFDLDAEECLQYLHETPVAEETWME